MVCVVCVSFSMYLSRSLCWDRVSHTLNMEMGVSKIKREEALPDYYLPVQISDNIKSGKYNNVGDDISRTNYICHMHNLLYLEEFQQRLDLRR